MRQFILLVILVLSLTPVTSEGQVRLIIGGGLSQPNGDFTSQVNTGLHGRAGLQVGVPVFPVSLRERVRSISFLSRQGQRIQPC